MLVLIGQIIFTLGVLIQKFSIMILDRIIFGMGGESFAVIQNRILFDYFKGRDLAMAVDFFNCLGRLETAFNYFITPFVDYHFSSKASCIIGCVLVSISFI